MRPEMGIYALMYMLSMLCSSMASALVGLKGEPEGSDSLRTGYLHTRGLLQAPAPAQKAVIAYARNREELVYALENSAKDVELHGHIDLREVEGGMEFEGTMLPALINQMRSLRGNCPEEATKSSKVPEVKSALLKPGQCVLITTSSMLSVETNFWLDNIYIMQRPGKAPLQAGNSTALVSVADQGKLWATDITIEGDRVSSQSGLHVLKGAQAFLDDCQFHHLGGQLPVINTAADLSMRQVVFQSNYASATANAPANPPAVIAVSAGDVMLEACLFTGNANHYVASIPSAKSLTKVYADPEVNIQVLDSGTGAASIMSTPLNQVPSPTDGSWSLFLSDKDDWFKQTIQALPMRKLAPQVSVSDSGKSRQHGAVGTANSAHVHSLPKEGSVSVAPADVTFVKTAQQLLDALSTGKRDIVIKAHMDLTALPTDDFGSVLTLLPSTRSVRGSCGAEDKPPASVTVDSTLENRQCILAAPHGLFRIPSASHIVWIDALQLHTLPQPAGTVRPDEIGAPRHIDVGGSAAMVFATRLVLKGAAAGSYAAALWDSSSAMHFEDTKFTGFTVPAEGKAIAVARGAMSLKACPLQNLAAPASGTAIFFADQLGSFTLKEIDGCSNCKGHFFMKSAQAEVYSDGSPGTAKIFNVASGTSTANAPLKNSPSGSDNAISLSHPWYKAVSTALGAWDTENASSGTGANNPPSDDLQKLFLPPPDISFVSTGQQLLQAIDDAAMDIVIQKHIDMRGMHTDALGYALPLSMNTRSVRGGSCTKEVPEEIKKDLDPALQSLAPGQCLLLADTGVFHLASHNHNLWMDALYVRVTSPTKDNTTVDSGRNHAPRALAVSSQGSMVFATDMTLQGDGPSADQQSGQQAVALWSGSSSIHIEDGRILDFSVPSSGSALVNAWGPMSMKRVTFQNDVAASGKALMFAENSGALKLEGVEVIGSTGATVMETSSGTAGKSVVFADKNFDVEVAASGATQPSSKLTQIPSDLDFNSLEDSWFLWLSKSLRAEPLEGKEISTPSNDASNMGSSANVGTAGDGSDKGLSAPALVGILVAATAVFCVLAMLWARWRYRRRAALKAEWHSTEMQAPKGGWPSDIPSSGHLRAGSLRSAYSLRSNYSMHSDASPLKSGLNTPMNRQSSMIKRSMSDMSSLQGSPRGSLQGNGLYPTPRGQTSSAANISDLGTGKDALPVEPLTKALDALCSSKRPFQGTYMALGPPHRRVGHSSVVQLFDDTETRRRVAIKFYLASACYDREIAMVSKKEVKNGISVEHHKVMTAAGDGPGGYKWPPCIVMDAGENLSSFVARAPKRDEATACAVMAEVAALIEALHDTGWAHRNLKPSNILFIADSDHWVLCDLERSARIGMSAPTCPPGEYTAPEVWSNLQSGRSPITTAAADVWALGALGFEIMTGERVLTSPHGAKRVCAEGLLDRAEEAASAGRLGVLRDVILDCLSQQPSMRPTARAIVPVLQAEVAGQEAETNRVLKELAELAGGAENYNGKRDYLEAVRSCKIIPLRTREILPAAPLLEPSQADVHTLVTEYCMALGPDKATFGKGVPLREQRLQAFKDINTQLNSLV